MFNDVTLSGTDQTNLGSAFVIAANTLSRLDSTDINGDIAVTQLGRTLPLADVSTLGLLALNDGRTFSDVLAFRTPQNTTVLQDYLAATGSPKVSGLLDYLRQYLSGTGVYSGLEAMMSASAAAAAMNVAATGATGNFALNFSLKLDRRFATKD